MTEKPILFEDFNLREIEELKVLARRRKALILAHYYCPPAVQEVANFVGDSLGLSQTAAASSVEVIIFAGVHFMAETASILCPGKKVVLVNPEAGCPMADMITYKELAARKMELPGVAVLTYVNSPAVVKTLSDMCCTSANVVPILKSMPAKTVLMTPDQNLAAFAQKLVPEKKIISWDGFCPTHHRLNRRIVDGLKAEYPEALVAAHPECRPEVLVAADFIGSTSAIIKYAKGEAAREFIILTEQGMGHRLRLDRSDAVFHFPEGMICPNMKKNTLADLRRALETLSPEVRVSAEIRRAALAPIEKMLRIT